MQLEALVDHFKRTYPNINFVQGKSFLWSPKEKTVFYSSKTSDVRLVWSLVHEVSHAILGHTTYESDFELLKIEAEAWDKAKQLGKQYELNISDDYVQDCIDTYRDWLYTRSSCPSCSNTSQQENPVTYKCFNCHTSWTVTESRLCRPYRLVNR